MRTFVLSFIVLIGSISCQTTSGMKTWSAHSYLISDEASLEPPTSLTSEQAKDDVQFLIGALQKGYGGRKYVPADKFQLAIDQLQNIRGFSSPQDLKNRIDEILYLIPDNHLQAHLNWETSPLRKAQHKIGRIGKNSIRDPKRPWSVGLHQWERKSVLVVCLTQFPSHKNPVWNGFIEAVEQLIPSAQAVILDFRGNGGGDDTKGLELAQYLSGKSFRYPIAKQVTSTTPESQAIHWNNIKFQMLITKKKNKEIPAHYWTLYNERKDLYEKSLRNGASDEQVGAYLENFNPWIGQQTFTKPIYILMDGECASSCESTIDGFEFLPNVQRVGQPTGGYIHFGNIGNILLPHSKIVVQIPTVYNEYLDHRYIERQGLQPHLVVPEGTDALDFVKAILRKR